MMQGMTRGCTDRPAPPVAAAWRWLLTALCASALLAGCGGSGSSGFDGIAAENKAIDRALDSGGCVTDRGLTICASSSTETPATPPPSPTPTALAETTGTPTGTPGAATSTPTPTATPQPAQPGVDIEFDPTDITNCAVSDAPSCRLILAFFPVSAPSGAAYRAAVRARDPDGRWRIYPVTGNQVAVDVPPGVTVVQAAVLLYEREPGPVPAEVDVLSASGADFAFVTAPIQVRGGAAP